MTELLKVLFLIFMLVAIVGLKTLFVLEIFSFTDFKKPHKKTQSNTPLWVQNMWAKHITREIEKRVDTIEKYKKPPLEITEKTTFSEVEQYRQECGLTWNCLYCPYSKYDNCGEMARKDKAKKGVKK